MYLCKFCGKECKNDNSLRNHERLCKLNPNRQIIKSNFIEYNRKRQTGELISWNKGLTKDTDERIKRMSDTLTKRYESGEISRFHTYTPEGLKKHLEGCRKGGGYRKGAGRGKNGWYKGIWCDSSWELAFVIYHMDRNLFIDRCHECRLYEYENKTYKYFPDFVTDEGIFEIKGYYSSKAKEKHIQNPDIKMLFGDDMKLYLDYVISTYGKDFVRLYDKKEKNVDVSPLPDKQLKE